MDDHLGATAMRGEVERCPSVGIGCIEVGAGSGSKSIEIAVAGGSVESVGHAASVACGVNLLHHP